MPKFDNRKIIPPSEIELMLGRWREALTRLETEFGNTMEKISQKSKTVGNLSSGSLNGQQELNKLISSAKSLKSVITQLNDSINSLNKSIFTQKENTEKLTAAERVNNQLSRQIANERARQTSENIKASASLTKLKAETKNLKIEQEKLNGTYKSSNGVFRTFGQSVVSLANSYLGIYALFNVGSKILNVTKQLDSFQYSLNAITETSEESSRSLLYLTNISNKYGQELITLGSNYVRFRAAAKATNISLSETQDIFESFTKVGAILGKSAADMDLIFMAIEQMVSKGTVASEELRRQLGERIPGAVSIMAKAMGISVAELGKMMKNSEVLTKDVLPAFAKQMELTFGADNIETIDTYQAALGRLSTAWELLVKRLSASTPAKGFTNWLANALQGISRIGLSPMDQALEATFDSANKRAEKFVDNLTITTEALIKQKKYEIEALKTENATLDQTSSKYLGNLVIIEDELLKIKELESTGKDVVTGDNLITAIATEADKSRSRLSKLTEEQAKLQNKLSESNKKKWNGFVSDKYLLIEESRAIEKRLNELPILIAREKNYADALIIRAQEQADSTEVAKEEVEVLGIISGLEKDIADTQKNIKISRDPKEIEELNKQVEMYSRIKDYYAKLDDDSTDVKDLQKRWEQLNGALEANIALQNKRQGITKKGVQEERIAISYEAAQLETLINDINSQPEDFIPIDPEIAKELADEVVRITKRMTEEQLRVARQKKLREDLGIGEEYRDQNKKQYKQDLSDLKQSRKDNLITEKEYHAGKLALAIKYHEDYINAIDDLVQSAGSLANELYQGEIDALDRKISKYDEDISALESKLEKEKELKDKGANNEYDREKARLLGLKKIREDAVEHSRKLQKRQALVDLAMQQSSMAVTIANIFKTNSPLGPVGWITAIAAAASVLASFASYKNKIAAIDADYEEYAEGTEYVDKEGKYPNGKDTVNAKLTRGERVFKVKQNKELGNLKNDEVVDIVKMFRYNFPNYNFTNQRFDDRPIYYLEKLVNVNERMYQKSINTPNVIDMGDGYVMLIYDKYHKEIVKVNRGRL